MTAVIEAKGIHKSFGKVEALRGVDLSVERGTIVGLLGPNGAGKTTLVRVLATLLPPDAGVASVAGLDVVRDAQRLREVIGLAGQAAAVDENLTGRENLVLVARLYHVNAKLARERAEDLIRRFDLVEAADRTAKTYSGGMRRRLDLAASLIGDPQILFMDEPTAGLDPRSRLALWNIIEQLRRDGKTILLTTQYLEEADRLADRIAVVDHGLIIAEGTSSELKAKVGGDVVEVTMSNEGDFDGAAKALSALGAENDGSRLKVVVPAANGVKSMTEAIRRLDAAGLEPADITLRRPTLDDAFLRLTGKRVEEAEAKK
ncbi:MAG: ATP-binding cassette domain-containing protein [Euryarchaeota archaeon]|nr:ATP-binding cassette domain-containing protein [Euryarchaeota archaeon]